MRIAIMITFVLALATPSIADYTWHTYSGPGHNNGHQYALTLGDKAFWADAEAQAVAIGGHLVTINDQAEQDWLITKFPYGEPDHPWIGLWQDPSDPGYSEPAGGWKWISGEPVTYTNWAGGEPNEAYSTGTNEDRAQMNAFAAGLWKDVPGGEYFQRGIIEVIPEPTSTVLGFIGLGCLSVLRRKRKFA